MAFSLKSLERAWRRLWISLITAALRARAASSPPDWAARSWRILFLRHDRIGDMIVTTGVLRAIARSHPTIVLDVLASPANAPVIAGAPWVHEVVVFDKRRLRSYLDTVRRLRAARYDVVVDCMVTAPSLTTLLLMLASGARHRLGIAGRGGLDSVLTIPVPPLAGDGHLIEHLGQLTIPFGVDPARTDLRSEIPLRDDERALAAGRWGGGAGATRLLVNVSAGAALRQWPEARFAETLRAAAAGHPALDVVVIGSPGERERAERIAAASDGGRYVATRSVREALALVATSDVVLTPDTSIAHAAAAFARPVVVLLGRGKGTRWTPYRTDARPVQWHESNIEALPSAPVIERLDALLAERPAARRLDFGASEGGGGGE